MGPRLKDQVAIITGGAQGIGRAIAEIFAKEGANLVLCDVDEDLVRRTAEEIGKTHSVQVLGTKANVSCAADSERVMKETLDKFGKIDILVNNAGITRDNLLMRMSEEEWDQVLDVNLKGTYLFAKAVTRPMMKARRGRIINISSVAAQIGNPGQANYSASKGGVISMTKALARELSSRNIIVNAVAPGFVKTRMTDVLPEELKQRLLTQVPLGRIGEPADIARAVLYLASDECSYMTGQVLAVNGGLYM